MDSSNSLNSINPVEDRSGKILPIISMLLVLFILVIFFVLSWGDLFPAGSQNFCGPGLCANDIFSGQKTCPSSSTSVVSFDPSFQTCNPPTGCSSDQAPCLYYDPTIGTICPGQDNFSSSCPAGTSAQNCGCTSRVYCPNFATVYFVENSVSSPGITGPSCTNLNSLVQQTVWIDATQLPRNDLPISPGPASISNNGNFFCGVNPDQLGNVWPPLTPGVEEGGGCLRGNLILSNELYYCANLPSGFSCGSGQIPVRQSNGDFTCQDF